MTSSAERPPHREPALIGLVALGGAVGTLSRYLLTAVIPSSGFPWATFGINVVGSLLLGVLLGALATQGEETRGRRRLRLTLGTGVLGGFTTYSALAVDTVALAGSTGESAALYAFGTLILGALAGGIGVGLGLRVSR